MPPFATSRIRIDKEQLIIMESMIAENSFLYDNDVDENDITFQPLINDINPADMIGLGNEREHIVPFISSPGRNRRGIEEHEPNLTSAITSPNTMRIAERIQDTNSAYDGCIFRKERDQRKSKIVLRLFIYVLVYSTAILLEYFDIGTGSKTIKHSRSKLFRFETCYRYLTIFERFSDLIVTLRKIHPMHVLLICWKEMIVLSLVTLDRKASEGLIHSCLVKKQIFILCMISLCFTAKLWIKYK